MVECTGLENRRAFAGSVSSNLTLSAILYFSSFLRGPLENFLIIQDSYFKRPLIKTMRRYFGTGVNLYGGRKAFSDLMLSKKPNFRKHQHLDGTFKY